MYQLIEPTVYNVQYELFMTENIFEKTKYNTLKYN